MKILVVDDNLAVASTFADVFRRAGNEVEIISPTEHDLAALPVNYHPDRVLIDVGLPKEVIDAVFHLYRAPVVAITAGKELKFPRPGVRVLAKPLDPKVVLDALVHAGEAEAGK